MLVPSPSCPLLFLPQHLSEPPPCAAYSSAPALLPMASGHLIIYFSTQLRHVYISLFACTHAPKTITVNPSRLCPAPPLLLPCTQPP